MSIPHLEVDLNVADEIRHRACCREYPLQFCCLVANNSSRDKHDNGKTSTDNSYPVDI